MALTVETYALATGLILVVSILFSMLGLGGGMLYVPIFKWLGLPLKAVAIPLGLLLNGITTLSAFLRYNSVGLVDFRGGLPAAAAGLLLAPVGAHLVQYLPHDTLVLVFAVVVSLAGMRTLVQSGKGEPKQLASKGKRIAVGSLVGGAAGFIAGLLGVGGGFIVAPIAIGGKVRKAGTIRRHLFHGGHSKDMLGKAATLELDAEKRDGLLVVRTRVTNSGAGHTLPGGATLRNILLVVEARDKSGKRLPHLGDKQELLPPLAGVGNTERDYAGRPGKMFARPFVTAGGMVPAGGFNADHELFNTRIPPRETDHSTFRFSAQEIDTAVVTARLIYRWTFKPMADKKGWVLKDIEMARMDLQVDKTVD